MTSLTLASLGSLADVDGVPSTTDSVSSSKQAMTLSSLGSLEGSRRSVTHSTQSVSSKLSLPDSFAAGHNSNGQALTSYHNEEKSLAAQSERSIVATNTSIVGGNDNDDDDDDDDDNSEAQLALQVAKEVKPMMHLLKILKEMDPDGEGGSGRIKGSSDAVASLISEFEDEVGMIENRIQNKNAIMNDECNNDSQQYLTDQSYQSGGESGLPPDWIELEDGGDVYFANEVTGETTWDRPTMPLKTIEQHDSSENDFSVDNGDENYDDNGNNDDDDDENNESENFEHLPLLPDWVAVDDSSGDIYYANEVTGETTWDRPTMSRQSQEHGNSVRDDEDEQYEDESNIAANDKDNDNLPPNWISVLDPDSGDFYYVNEDTGESTWDKPINTANEAEETLQISQDLSELKFQNNQYTTSMQSFGNDTEDDVDDDEDLPPGWTAITDPGSGDVYYADEDGNTTWDRPVSVGQNAPQSLETSQYSMNSANLYASDDYDNLPPGWTAITDPASGDEYYVNEATGETTWDRPAMPQNLLENGSSLHINNDDEYSDDDENDIDNKEDDDLPPMWFSVVDKDSGEVYYANEETGETSWDRPINNSQAGVIATTNPHNNIAVADEHDDLPDDWFPVIDQSSGDTYYVNEVTGETSWDKPIGSRGVQAVANHVSRMSMSDNIVYEDVSVSSSINF